MTPMKKGDEFGNRANGLTYIQYCSYFRRYEPQATPQEVNASWASFTKESY